MANEKKSQIKLVVTTADGDTISIVSPFKEFTEEKLEEMFGKLIGECNKKITENTAIAFESYKPAPKKKGKSFSEIMQLIVFLGMVLFLPTVLAYFGSIG